jgi:hypothetical protein
MNLFRNDLPITHDCQQATAFLTSSYAQVNFAQLLLDRRAEDRSCPIDLSRSLRTLDLTIILSAR